MLGFPGALDATVRSEYGQPSVSYTSLSNVQCNGSEDSIFDCPYESNPSCAKSRSAGVQCLGMQLHTNYKFNNTCSPKVIHQLTH